MGNCIVGSNPTPSAILSTKQAYVPLGRGVRRENAAHSTIRVVGKRFLSWATLVRKTQGKLQTTILSHPSNGSATLLVKPGLVKPGLVNPGLLEATRH